MKKIFTFFIVCACASMMSAQTVIAHTPIQDVVGMPMAFFAENMSPDQNYVVGLDKMTNQPVVWDRINDMYVAFDAMDTVWNLQYNYQQDTMWNPIYNEDYTEIIGQELAWNYIYNEDFEIIDSTCLGDNYAVILSIDTLGFNMEPATGSFHAISSTGVAVGDLGAAGNGKPFAANVITSAIIKLAMPEGFTTGSAYAISADGQTIVGFYFDASWYTVPCVWTNGGQTVTMLPIPTETEMGFTVEYASVRYMSEDASILMGYAQNYNNGNQVMVLWRKNEQGEYVIDGSLARTMYNSNVEWIPTIPYSYFEGTCLSANGEWVGLKLSTNTDPFDWEVSPENRLGRYNTNTGALEYISLGDFTGEIFGIANDGTAVGTYEEMELGSRFPVKKALLWKAGENEAYEESEVLVDSYFTEQEEKEVKFSAISADGQYVLGKMDYIYTPVDEEGAMLADPTVEIESFIIDLNMPASVENVEANVNANVNKRLENNQIVIEKDGVRYSVLGKVLSAK